MSQLNRIRALIASAAAALTALRLRTGGTKRWAGGGIALGAAAAIGWLIPLEAQGAQTTFHTDPEYLIDSWETDQGLPENSATAIVQTPDGYLWFGTFNGLVRFNGIECTVFDPDNTPELPSGGIVNLHLDKRGRLWVSTYRGLVVRADGQWRQLHSEDGWQGDYARTFAERANGDLLITAFNGKLFEFSAGQLAELPPPPGEKGKGYLGGVDEDGHWWVVQNKFIGRWENGQWVRMISAPGLAQDAVGCAPARGGGLWVLLGIELRKLRRGAEVARITLPEPPGGVWSVSEDSQGNVWIATFDQGVCRVAANGTMTRWSAANGGSDKGRCVFEDRERNLWIGTSGDGLTRFVPRRFQHFAPEDGRKALQVQSVWPDSKGGVWAGTYSRGLFQVGEGGTTNVTLPGLAGKTPYVKSVLTDHSGRLWVGTAADAVWVVENGESRHLPSGQTGGHNIHALFEDSRRRIWISGGSAVAVFDGNASQGFGAEQGLPVGTVTCFAEDSTGAIWACNDSGVFRSVSDPNFAEVLDATGKPIRGIGCLMGDADGSMWLGSSDRGLLRWKEGKLVVLDARSGFPVTAVHGLVEDKAGFFWMTSVRSIVRARRHDLQALADGAPADGRVARLTCQVFDANDGLPNGEFTQGRQPTCALDSKGRLWFATTKGVAMTEPAALRVNDAPPPVLVEGVSFYQSAPPATNHSVTGDVREQVLTNLRGPFAAPVSLPAGSRRIEVRSASLSLVAAEKARYQIRLDGHDENWQDIGNRRVAYYHELSPRDYVFRVRAANNDGVWNETGASLAFTVQPFFWQTMWFRIVGALLCVAAGGGAVWAWARSHVQRAEERGRLARAETEAQQRLNELTHLTRVSTLGEISGSLAHELNQPLGAILVNTEAAELHLKNPTPNLVEVRAILEDIRKDDLRAGDIIHGMRALLRRQELAFQPLDLGELVDEVVRLIRADAAARKTSVGREVPFGLPRVLGDSVHLQQVLINLLVNGMDAMSTRPVAERRVVIRATQPDPRTVEIAVSDAGVGIPPGDLDRVFTAFHTTKPGGLGLGLPICRSIIEAHGGSITIANNPDRGTTALFTLKAIQEAPAG